MEDLRSEIHGEDLLAGDQAGGAAKAEVKPSPLKEDEKAILKFHDIENVNEEPDHPGRETGKTHPAQIGDSLGAADGGKITFVEIMERAHFFILEAALNQFPDVMALLNGGLSDSGKRLAGLMAETGDVADDEDFGVAGNRQVRLDDDAADAVELNAVFLGKDKPEWRGEDAGGPENRARGNCFRAIAFADGDC